MSARAVQEPCRILRDPMQANLEMQVGSRRTARRADACNPLAGYDEIAGSYEHQRSVGIARRKTVAVVDFHQLSVFGVLAGEHHLTAGCGEDRRSRLRRKIDAFVKRVVPGERIDPITEVRREQ